MTTLAFKAPDENTPGFLRIQRNALKLRSMWVDPAANETVIDQLITFLLPFVTEPADPAAAREALMDATERQFMDMLEAITSSRTAPPLAKSGNSGSG